MFKLFTTSWNILISPGRRTLKTDMTIYETAHATDMKTDPTEYYIHSWGDVVKLGKPGYQMTELLDPKESKADFAQDVQVYFR